MDGINGLVFSHYTLYSSTQKGSCENNRQGCVYEYMLSTTMCDVQVEMWTNTPRKLCQSSHRVSTILLLTYWESLTVECLKTGVILGWKNNVARRYAGPNKKKTWHFTSARSSIKHGQLLNHQEPHRLHRLHRGHLMASYQYCKHLM